jgi:hypothetical protein
MTVTRSGRATGPDAIDPCTHPPHLDPASTVLPPSTEAPAPVTAGGQAQTPPLEAEAPAPSAVHPPAVPPEAVVIHIAPSNSPASDQYRDSGPGSLVCPGGALQRSAPPSPSASAPQPPHPQDQGGAIPSQPQYTPRRLPFSDVTNTHHTVLTTLGGPASPSSQAPGTSNVHVAQQRTQEAPHPPPIFVQVPPRPPLVGHSGGIGMVPLRQQFQQQPLAAAATSSQPPPPSHTSTRASLRRLRQQECRAATAQALIAKEALARFRQEEAERRLQEASSDDDSQSLGSWEAPFFTPEPDAVPPPTSPPPQPVATTPRPPSHPACSQHTIPAAAPPRPVATASTIRATTSSAAHRPLFCFPHPSAVPTLA